MSFLEESNMDWDKICDDMNRAFVSVNEPDTKVEFKTDWEQVRIQAAIAAMPIANNIVDNLYSADYHGTEVSKLHSIEKFTQECVAIADALIEELKKEK